MTYSDNNPERRNLTILSLAIIIFYLAKGTLVGDNLNFTLVNIRFEDKGMLIIIVWSMLLWFLFRYVVTNRHEHGKGLERINFAVNMDYAPVRKYLKNNNQPNYPESSLRVTPCKVYADTNSDWQFQSGGGGRTPLKGLDGYLIIKLFLLKIIFKHRATTDYYTPYLLFLIAVSLGINEHLFDLSYVLVALPPLLLLLTIEALYYIRD